ncbi:hypothetical protein NRA51_12590 [Acinetobacter baumannii]|nr:hypothetical protein [Acinetobacter baumannii]
MNCIYCNCHLNGSNKSQEHVIPQWIIKKLGIEKNQHEFVPISENLEEFEHRTPITNKLTHSICNTCNNGWLSHIDESCKNVLSKLITGTNVPPLDLKNNYEKICTLIYKIFLNLFATAPKSFKNKKLYAFHNFFIEKKPPSNVFLFLSNIRNNSPVSIHHADIWLSNGDETLIYKQPHGVKFKFFLQLGKVSFVMCSTGDISKTIIFDPKFLLPLVVSTPFITGNLGISHVPPEPFEDNIAHRILYNSIQMVELS